MHYWKVAVLRSMVRLLEILEKKAPNELLRKEIRILGKRLFMLYWWSFLERGR